MQPKFACRLVQHWIAVESSPLSATKSSSVTPSLAINTSLSSGTPDVLAYALVIAIFDFTRGSPPSSLFALPRISLSSVGTATRTGSSIAFCAGGSGGWKNIGT